ncbi:hypothetical protein DPMN_087503 [Dreissena polymorpha]|uniref:Uncharacterized protein n=1 Tax=Dreissena polymorpha TaxID=45954 RepID=A0A9D4KSD7_DREPO|nr:hypothetical protein DPMN_087503 [Dreissena polymorpha]
MTFDFRGLQKVHRDCEGAHIAFDGSLGKSASRYIIWGQQWNKSYKPFDSTNL